MKDHPPGAAIALAAGILSLPLAFCPLLGGPLALTALIVASISRRRVRERPDAYRESSMPSAATVCGIIGLTVTVLVFLLWVFVLALAAAGAHAPKPASEPLLF
jgi:hypothetical protein